MRISGLNKANDNTVKRPNRQPTHNLHYLCQKVLVLNDICKALLFNLKFFSIFFGNDCFQIYKQFADFLLFQV